MGGKRWTGAFEDIRGWGARRYLVALMAGLGWLVISGTPTDIIDTPLFVRMTPVEWWNYPFWLASAVLAGLLAATYVAGPGAVRTEGSQRGKAVGGGLLSVFAVGCPVCNKLVVLALGAGGALTYFAPIQPILGFLSVGLLLYALQIRLSAERSCAVGESPASGGGGVAVPAAVADPETAREIKDGGR